MGSFLEPALFFLRRVTLEMFIQVLWEDDFVECDNVWGFSLFPFGVKWFEQSKTLHGFCLTSHVQSVLG